MKARSHYIILVQRKEVSKLHVTFLFCSVYGTCFGFVTRKLSVGFEPRCEKTLFGVSDQVPHKPGGTATEDG